MRIDRVRNLWYKQRTVAVIASSGDKHCYEWESCTHPVSMEEVSRWLAESDFTVHALYGNRQGAPFGTGNRAIFWAQLDNL